MITVVLASSPAGYAICRGAALPVCLMLVTLALFSAVAAMTAAFGDTRLAVSVAEADAHFRRATEAQSGLRQHLATMTLPDTINQTVARTTTDGSHQTVTLLAIDNLCPSHPTAERRLYETRVQMPLPGGSIIELREGLSVCTEACATPGCIGIELPSRRVYWSTHHD